MNRFLPAVFALSVLAIASCKKAENEPVPQDHLRSGGSWRQFSGTVTYRLIGVFPARDTTIDVFTTAAACAKDNRIIFDKGYTARLLFLGQNCVAGEPGEREIQYEVTTAESMLHIYNATEMFGTDAVNAVLLNSEPGRFTIRYPIFSNPTPNDRDTVYMTSVFTH